MARVPARPLRERDRRSPRISGASRPASWSARTPTRRGSCSRKKLAQHRGVVVVAVASAIALGAVGVESFRRVVAEREHRAQRARAAPRTRCRRPRSASASSCSLQAGTVAAQGSDRDRSRGSSTYAIADDDRAHVVDRRSTRRSRSASHATCSARATGCSTRSSRPTARRSSSPCATARSARTISRPALRCAMLGHAPSAPEVLAITPDGRARGHRRHPRRGDRVAARAAASAHADRRRRPHGLGDPSSRRTATRVLVERDTGAARDRRARRRPGADRRPKTSLRTRGRRRTTGRVR